MAKYIVYYSETYADMYEVEANSEKEANEKVYDEIFEGKRKGPDTCKGWDAKAYLCEE